MYEHISVRIFASNIYLFQTTQMRSKQYNNTVLILTIATITAHFNSRSPDTQVTYCYGLTSVVVSPPLKNSQIHVLLGQSKTIFCM